VVVLFGIIVACFVVFLIITRIQNIEVPSTDISYSKPFLGPAVQLLTWFQTFCESKQLGGKSAKRRIKNARLTTNLQILHPGESTDLQIYRFRAERLSTILLVVFIGACCGLLNIIQAEKGRIIDDNNIITRNEYGGLDIDADLIAGIDVNDEDINTDIEYIIPARKYSKDEVDVLFEDMSSELELLILNKNDTPDHIVSDLNLVKNVEGYPFTINWECDNYEYLDADGRVHNEDLDEQILVNLIADCIYEHQHWYLCRTVQICPQEFTFSERLLNEIEKAISEADMQSETEQYLTLPSEIPSGKITWKEKISDDSPLIIFLMSLICVFIPPIKEAEVNSRIKKRSRALLVSYPLFISKLTLYMSAGMSARNSFLKMGHDFDHIADKSKDYMQIELSIAAHELELGISETEVYEGLGKRCGNREYMRFSSLLCQNLRKGSNDLLKLLKKESEDAFILRKNEARKLGEEASTKLLLPMIMMLSIVMVIIMVPAYMSFSS